MKVKIPVFFNTDETLQLEDLGIESNLADCELRDVTFYNINYISPYLDKDNTYTTIASNGTSFISPLSTDEVENLIEEADYIIGE